MMALRQFSRAYRAFTRYPPRTSCCSHSVVSPNRGIHVSASALSSVNQELVDEMIQEFRQDKKTQATPPPEDPEAQLFEQIQQARHDPYPLEGAHGVHEIPETYENLDEYIESDEYVPEQDHFYDTISFSPNQIKITSQEMLNGDIGDSPNDKKVTLCAHISKLGLDPVVEKYVKLIAGKRYQWDKQRVYLVSRKFATSHENKRHVLELLHSIIMEARQLASELGDFHLPHAQPKRYGYRQTRLKKKRKGKRGWPF